VPTTESKTLVATTSTYLIRRSSGFLMPQLKTAYTIRLSNLVLPPHQRAQHYEQLIMNSKSSVNQPSAVALSCPKNFPSEGDIFTVIVRTDDMSYTDARFRLSRRLWFRSRSYGLWRRV